MELILWVGLGVLAGVALGWVIGRMGVPFGWDGEGLSADGLSERIGAGVRRELRDLRLRGWQSDAAARDAVLASAQECARREARDVVREVWRAEAAGAGARGGAANVAAGARDFSQKKGAEGSGTGGVR